MRYSFAIGMRISGQRDDLERALDRVMDELVRLNAADPSISATIDEGEVEISVVVLVPSEPGWSTPERRSGIRSRAAQHGSGGNRSCRGPETAATGPVGAQQVRSVA